MQFTFSVLQITSVIYTKGNNMLDLSKVNLSQAAEAGYEFELRIPGTMEPTGAFVTVRGEQSPTVKNYGKRKYQEFKMKEAAARRRGKEPEELTLDEAEELAVESAIVRIISWKGITEGGKEVPFTKENAERILKEHTWIREQIMEESSQLLNFQSK